MLDFVTGTETGFHAAFVDTIQRRHVNHRADYLDLPVSFR